MEVIVSLSITALTLMIGLLARMVSVIKIAKKEKIQESRRQARLEKGKSSPLGKYLQEFYLSKEHWDKIYYNQTPSRDPSIIFKHNDGTVLVFGTKCYDENIIYLKTTTMLSGFPTVTNKPELEVECIKEGFSLIEFFRERVLLGYEERLKCSPMASVVVE